MVALWIEIGIGCIWLFGFLAFSSGVGLFPTAFYEKLQWSPHRKFYEKLGIKAVGKFTQNGNIVNRVAGPNNRPGKGRDYFKHFHKTIALYERYHYMAFVFSSLSCLLACFKAFYVLASLITLSNGMYNVLPILLQQYNKVRLRNAGF